MMKTERMRSITMMDRGFRDLIPLSCGYELCDGGHIGYGMRDYYMIHYVRRGRGRLEIYGRSYSVGAGCIFVIPAEADAVYRADDNDPWEYVWVCFVGEAAGRLSGLKKPVVPVSHLPFDMLQKVFEQSEAREEIAVAALFLIFAEIFSGEDTKPNYVKYTVETINFRYMNHLTVGEIAQELSIDRRYLARIFHAKMGVSVKEYITSVRMERAKELLREGRGVGLTAELVGYNDSFNFSKMFKKHTGKSPMEVRKQWRE